MVTLSVEMSMAETLLSTLTVSECVDTSMYIAGSGAQ